MSGASYIKISRLSVCVSSEISLEYGQDPKLCNCSSKIPIEVSVVDKNNQSSTVQHVGHCTCEAFLVADRLATAMGLPIYDDGNVL